MSSAASMLRLRVSPVAESNLRAGHPWLFAGSIRDQNRQGRLGELAAIYDRKDEFLAIGLFDPESPIRVRVLHAGRPRKLDDAWWRARLQQALARRDGLFDAQTNGYRLIHGESDGWPGLVLDRYDRTLVLKLYTAAWLPWLAEVARNIFEALQPERPVLRLSRNIQETAREEFSKQDGQALSREVGEAGSTPSPPSERGEGWGEEGDRTHGAPLSPLVPRGEREKPGAAFGGALSRVTFLESGLRFEADVVKGQKTGFFLDQRENRRRVESLAAGRDVLNAFSFSGGFSLYAARGGAKSVTDLDISAHALESARRNFALNQDSPPVARCRHEMILADAFEWLERNAARQFDLVVLDPPSLAKRETDRAGAIQAYARLATNGLRALRPAGILVAASCSAHVSADEFFEAVRSVAKKSGRAMTELETTGHPADHPATFKEAEYLKCIYLKG
jgi:23S rRNA (cytosine1962-C5)-methyltransferase